ncbi:SusD/RagB family nutrient-binding outer membrane lipoprotein [Flavobacterium sp. P21]|uniref:SusD/RagB family nutrient-binding outer membrane lipoprotein n=1 Tax=Flavobacterium sp. P21 TaxID=3423948 RepID=UPI003D66EC97
MKKIIAILAVGLSMTACVNEDANTDPNSAYSTVPGSLITYAQKELSDYTNTPSVNENNFRLTMQYWQETTYVNESNYDFTNRNVSNQIYSDNYVNVLNNLGKAKTIISAYEPTADELATWPANKKTQLAIIDILQVYTFQLLVDTFGNIPYTQAANLAQYPLPAYDDGATIYADLITRINADITALSSGTANSFPTFADGDKIYGGDPASWKTFANSLKLKLAIGIADSNPTLAQTTALAAIAGGVMTSPASNAHFPYLPASPNYNPLYENLEASGREDFVGGKTLVDYMNASNDPRRPGYFTTVGGQYIGLPIGEGGEFAEYSHAGDYAYTPDTPGNIITATEVAFYVAEANARWNTVCSTSSLQCEQLLLQS